MPAKLDHTIIWVRDSAASAAFYARVLGLGEPRQWGPFEIVDTGNGVSLDFLDERETIAPQHYAFLVEDDEFDAILGRIRDMGLSHWADPARRLAGAINRHDDGRGVYFDDPDGHLLEVITRRYGSGGWTA